MSTVIYRIGSITEFATQWPDEHAVWLSTFELEQLQACRHAQRRREWLAGRWLCKQLIQQQTAIQSMLEIDIQSRDVRSRTARPRVLITGQMQALDVSISHSHDWVAVAICTTWGCRIGIDLVPLSVALPDALSFWLTQQEQEWLIESGQSELLPIIWSIKESVYKATNRGESFRPHQMEVRRSETGNYECHVATPFEARKYGARLHESACSWPTIAAQPNKCLIAVSTFHDHIFTKTTHHPPSLAEAS